MSMRNGVALFTSVCLLLLCSLTVFAQSQTTGSVEGVVKDPNGAVVVGAEVVVASKATGDERRVTTGESGAYAVPLLPPGSYRIQINASGFRPVVFEEVTVSITETTSIPVELGVGGLTGETVVVNASGPIVQSDSSQLGRVVDSRTVAELPLATRNFTQILGLSTGTATYLPDNTAVGRNSQNISVNGGRVTNNNLIKPDLPGIESDRYLLSGDAVASGYRSYSELTAAASDQNPQGIEITNEDLFNIIYSSGTTGQPKGIVHTHYIRAMYCTLFASAYRIRPESIILHAGSIVFNGAFLTLMPSMYVGRHLYSPGTV